MDNIERPDHILRLGLGNTVATSKEAEVDAFTLSDPRVDEPRNLCDDLRWSYVLCSRVWGCPRRPSTFNFDGHDIRAGRATFQPFDSAAHSRRGGNLVQATITLRRPIPTTTICFKALVTYAPRYIRVPARFLIHSAACRSLFDGTSLDAIPIEHYGASNNATLGDSSPGKGDW